MGREENYDVFLGISTDKEQEDYDGGEHYKFESTRYAQLQLIFDHIELKETDTLVDFGAGLGRAMFYTNFRFNCYTKGVEIDKDLFRLLEYNRDCYVAKFMDREEKIKVYNMDCLDYEIDKKDNVFYFFNPFGENIFSTMIEKIIESARKTPRNIRIIIYYLTPKYASIIRKYPLVQKEVFKLSNYFVDPDEKGAIFTISPAAFDQKND